MLPVRPAASLLAFRAYWVHSCTDFDLRSPLCWFYPFEVALCRKIDTNMEEFVPKALGVGFHLVYNGGNWWLKMGESGPYVDH